MAILTATLWWLVFAFICIIGGACSRGLWNARNGGEGFFSAIGFITCLILGLLVLHNMFHIL